MNPEDCMILKSTYPYLCEKLLCFMQVTFDDPEEGLQLGNQCFLIAWF